MSQTNIWIKSLLSLLTISCVCVLDGCSKATPEKKEVMHGTFVVDDVRDPNTGELTRVNRMCGTGIFNDPNDFALISGKPVLLTYR